MAPLPTEKNIFTTVPPQIQEKKSGQLRDEQIRQFFEEGFVVVEDFFDKETELEPCREAINKLVDDCAKKWFAAGKIHNLHSDKGFNERLTYLEKELPGATVLLHKLGKLPVAFQKVWSNERILNVVEQLIGSDIQGHPVWNLRTKCPNNEATVVPWHQDSAYLDENSYDVLQVTAWIPLIDANETNGCMQVVRKGHKKGIVAKHSCCVGNTWYVMLEPEEMINTLECDMESNVVTCPVPYGGVLLLSNMIPHQSLPNKSNIIRWSLDLRWQKSNTNVGFHGLKEGIEMRRSGCKYEIDWKPFLSQKQMNNILSDPSKTAEENEFDTTITGPWMKRWEIVHENKHTDRLQEIDNAYSKP
ncbi:DgyrCDS9751 [Dimorphilus gyrociliatus]|uniref:DgyrCDS9751 n=1 Tax=Dimorphilus gyrociliatus TaxID=2664684 RepID=A0A7I8VYA0_9ANNE|nr:DgyrCDS9751 [Dimorphilus gyrociliatus]